MIKRMIIMLFLCALVLGGLFGFKMYGKKMMMAHMAGMANPVHTVSTINAKPTDWQNEIKAVGTLRAAKGSDISAEVVGTVEHIFMESGQDVDEGTVLLQMRSADDYANLQALIAKTRLAQLTVDRDAKQLKVQAISQATYDTDIATLETLKAEVEAQKVLLEKKTVMAPFSGRLGLRKVDVGQYLAAGTPIVTLQQMDPIYLDFFVPQQDLSNINVGQKIMARTDAIAGQTFEGEITAIESKVDEATRNIQVRATFKNQDKTLRPGMFATATLAQGTPQRYLTLPQSAITFNPYGSTVYVVKKDGTDDKGRPVLKAMMAFVKTGLTRGDQIAILDGIKDGDEIVTAGQMKLQNGSLVTINNNVQPKNDAAPAPVDK
ncbi:MAG: efflux RND transporter periplasmic adaptor subunit [Alphaproteobacteria bacterium]|nr:efflux RND transporter periplasmic adaptor subunit [Alphaproteobacteria bacterium]